MAADKDPEPLDVDEDGNPVAPAPSEEPKPGAETPEIVAPLVAVRGPMFRPQPVTGQEITVLGQHYDVAARYANYLNRLDTMFQQTDYLFEIDVNAYWKLKGELDKMADEIIGQLFANEVLAGGTPRVQMQYEAIEDSGDGWGAEIRGKTTFLSALIKKAGLGTKDAAIPYESIPTDRMHEIFRFVDWSMKPSDLELEKYGVAQVAAYFKENMIDLGLDVFLVIEAPRRIYPFGSGKSTLGLEIMGACANVLDVPFDMRRDIAYQMDYPRVKRFLEDNRLNQIRGVDEAKRIWSRRTPMSPKQRDDMQALSMNRKDSQIWVTHASNIFRLDHDIFEEKATHVLRVQDPGRTTIRRGWGRATLYEKGDHDEDEDTWGSSQMQLTWMDLPPPPKRVYAKCIGYTNVHAREILEEGASPLDRLLQKHPETWADLLEGWPEQDPIDWDPRRTYEPSPGT